MPSSPGDVEARVASLDCPVRLIFFTQTFGCDTCLVARQIIDQVAALSDQISVEEVNVVLDKERAAEFGIDRAPAIAIVGKNDVGMRYYGTPSGYELASLFDAVLLAGSGDLGLAEDSLERLQALEQPIDIKVFVTPTCAYCPQAVSLAYRFAAASPLVTATAIEATEFPDLAREFQVSGVPKTVANGSVEILGAQPEGEFLSHVLDAVLEVPLG